MAEEHPFIPLEFRELPPDEMAQRARRFADQVHTRRSVREFSSRPVPEELIREAVRAAGSAPSGANQQPWHFVAVGETDLKQRIRRAAEEEERRFYEERAPEPWLEALEPLGTDPHKPFLEHAPWLLAVFAQMHGDPAEGGRKHYYVMESVGIACGILLTALHHMGLATLTHTPSPMGFLREILGRPDWERPYLLIPVGYPAPGATVPDIERKPVEEILEVR